MKLLVSLTSVLITTSIAQRTPSPTPFPTPETNECVEILNSDELSNGVYTWSGPMHCGQKVYQSNKFANYLNGASYLMYECKEQITYIDAVRRNDNDTDTDTDVDSDTDTTIVYLGWRLTNGNDFEAEDFQILSYCDGTTQPEPTDITSCSWTGPMSLDGGVSSSTVSVDSSRCDEAFDIVQYEDGNGNDEKETNVGAVYAAIIVGFLLIAALNIALCWFIQKKKLGSQPLVKVMDENELDEMEDGKIKDNETANMKQ